MPELTKRQLYNCRKSELWAERSSWVSQWRDISSRILPRNGRFLVSDRNRGDKRHNSIIDNTGTRALRTLAAGLMAGMTSPARPWFRLATSDTDLMEHHPVKTWLNQVTELMRQVFARSNTYRALHSMYEELGAFGTAANNVLPDFKTVVHHYPMTVGEYAIATDHRSEVNALYREYDMTVGAMVGQFGLKNVSPTVKNLYDKGRLDAWATVTHVIEPREDRDTRSRLAKDMPYASCYYESASTDDSMLKESGYKRFTALCPRWAASGGDIYGNSPGMEAYGDVGQLQHQQFRKGQGIDYMVKPPLQLPSSMKNVEFNSLPGGASYVENTGSGIKAAFEVRLDLQHLLADIVDVRSRVEETFYKNLFLMLAQDTRSGITAREVAERHEEKLLMLGPVLERLHNELLKRLIDICFDALLEAGVLPPPPPELHGMDLNVEFVSMLAQAQRAIGTGAIDRYTMAMGQIAQFKPGVLDKFDEDEWADIYGDMLGIDPTLIVADDKVAIIRQQRAEAGKAAQQQAALAQGAQTAQTLSQADTQGKNALTDVISSFSGYSGPGLPAAA